ncbi:hypothetical protein [Actinoplanes sp. NPDC051851]|uniref:hypothetical protein n=1 Tax=Actinoplanes sp. NPDC051851 TaxID=3154753 RepID=UPI0034216D67
MNMVSHASRPEVWDRIPSLFDGILPEYNLHGDVMAGYWKRLFAEFGAFQLALIEGDDVLAVARSLPIPAFPAVSFPAVSPPAASPPTDSPPTDSFPSVSASGAGPSVSPLISISEAGASVSVDGGGDALPGIDDAIVAGFSGEAPTVLCALGIEVAPAHQGRRYAVTMLDALRDLAASAGFGHLVAPLRPTWKERYPLTPISRYAAWTTETGEPFDPWLRKHVTLGGTLGTPAHRSSMITGTVHEWETWTGMAFPESGSYVFPHGLAPLLIDRTADRGTYWEPCVWVSHPAGEPRLGRPVEER